MTAFERHCDKIAADSVRHWLDDAEYRIGRYRSVNRVAAYFQDVRAGCGI